MNFIFDLLQSGGFDSFSKMDWSTQRPFCGKENDGKCYFYFDAIGIPKENISYSTKYNADTNTICLNITGEYAEPDGGFKNSIDANIPIDTDLHYGYEVNITNGLVKVILHEKKKPEPKLKDLSNR